MKNILFDANTIKMYENITYGIPRNGIPTIYLNPR